MAESFDYTPIRVATLRRVYGLSPRFVFDIPLERLYSAPEIFLSAPTKVRSNFEAWIAGFKRFHP
jgi:hypothetical protein